MDKQKKLTGRPELVAALVTASAAILLLLALVLYAKSNPSSNHPATFMSVLVTLLAILVAGAFIFATFRIELELPRFRGYLVLQGAYAQETGAGAH